MNNELAVMLLRVLGTTLAVMAVIALCCIATPHLAKRIDKRLPPRPRQDEESEDGNVPTVKGPYDASSEQDYDLNYKIYNKDIYGVDFKNGKKRKKQDG